jgi:hypothetical protein
VLSIAHHLKNARRWEWIKANAYDTDTTGMSPDELERWVDQRMEGG